MEVDGDTEWPHQLVDEEEEWERHTEPDNGDWEQPSVRKTYEPAESSKRKWDAFSFDAEMNMDRAASLPSSTDPSFDAAVRDSWNECVRDAARSIVSKPLILPWEQGLAAQVLGDHPWMPYLDNMPVAHNPFAFLHNQDAADQHKAKRAVIISRMEAVPGAWKLASKRLESLQITARDMVDKRSIALEKWKQIVVIKPECSRLGRTLLTDLLAFKGDSYLLEVINDVMASKSTATLDKRANHLLLFIAYAQRLHKEPFPVDEQVFYSFLRDVQSGKSPSSATSCKESLNFTLDLIGLDGAEEAASSSRVLGLCKRLLLTKKPRRQAKVLTRTQIVAIERTLMDPEAWLPDRIFAGHCLFLIYGRIRWGDAEKIVTLTEDLDETGGGYLQADSLGSKTSQSAQQKTSFLPFVAVVRGLELQCWHQTWLKLRTRAALVELPRQQDDSRPFMPAIDHHGTFHDSVPLSSSDASKWLRQILLQTGQTPDQVSGITSHALKAVVLSWMAKAGKPPFHRKVAGYHAIRGESSLFSYSRDNMSATLRVVQQVVDMVACGTLNPDSTRSGYFKPVNSVRFGPQTETAPVDLSEPVLRRLPTQSSHDSECELTDSEKLNGLETNAEFEVVDAENNSDSNSSDSSDNDTQSDADSDLVLAICSARDRSAPADSVDRFAVHKFLNTLHKLKESDDQRLACGRLVSKAFRLISSEPLNLFHRCKVCFGSVIDVDADN